MRKVIVVIPVESAHKRLLEEQIEADFVYTEAGKLTAQDVREACAIIGNVPPSLLGGAEQLKLLQLNSAGADGYTAEGVLPSGAVLANATGAYGLAISEHMLGMVLMLMKKLHGYRDSQKLHAWRDLGPVGSVWGSTTLIVGMGDIGGEFGKRMKALGSRVIGIRRTGGEKPDYADAVDTIENLDRYLAEADIVALSLPGTPETYHLFDRDRLSKMKQDSILLNVGRGSAIETEALIRALKEGPLGACGIDVAEEEPLGQNSPLWEAENLLITPHVSGGFHLRETFERIVRIAARNLHALAAGEAFINVVDPRTGYRMRS